MNIKKVLLLLISMSVLSSNSFLSASANDYVEGGKLFFDFEDENQLEKFDLYSDKGNDPQIKDGMIITNYHNESKIIISDYYFTDFDMNMDLYSAYKNGRIDTGFYFQASNISYGVDSINALNLHVVKNDNENTFDLFLYSFRRAFVGAVESINGIPFIGDHINLRAKFLSGKLYAYVNNEETPRFVRDIQSKEGQIGIRSFFTVNMIDNLEIYGSEIEMNYDGIDECINAAKEILKENITLGSKEKIERAIERCENTRESCFQKEVDDAIINLNKAMNSVLRIFSSNDLEKAIAEAEKLTKNQEIYTKNSWAALQNTIEQAKRYINGSEDEISLWTKYIFEAIDDLNKYEE